LTQSEYGFIGGILHTGEGEPYLKTYAITNIAWNDETRKLYDEYASQGLEFHNLNTLFGAAMTSGDTVLSNDPATDPRSGGLPEGHPPLNAFLGLPIYSGDEMVGMAGVANRPGGYSDETVSYLQPYIVACANIIEAHRNMQLRKRAESALRDSEEKFRNLVEQSLVGVYIIQDNLFKYVNPRFAEIFGYAPEEIINVKSPRDLVLSDDWPRVGENLARRESGKTDTLDNSFRGVTRQGKVVHVEIHGSSTVYEGRAAALGVLMDVTERLLAQEEIIKSTQQMAMLRQAGAQLEEVNRLKSEFLASMSHELRTPLNAVIGLSQVLVDGTYGPLTDKQSEYLTGISESGKHLLSLINDILDLSKIEAGKERLEYSVFNMADMLRKSFMMVREKALKHRIELEQEIDTGIGGFYADERRVKQIIFNLLSNAVKFTEPGGRVGLKAAQDEKALTVTVWDTGIGIPDDKKHLLFKPFQMVDSSLSRGRGGTGLGLVLTRKLTEMHGGTISFESKTGEGTSFKVTLPVKKPGRPDSGGLEAAPKETWPEGPGSGAGKKVMVVEDNHLNMLLVADYLKNSGFEVIEATNGEIAIEKTSREMPDIILMDIQMPGIDGFEALTRLKENPATSGIPVIAMTALAMKGDEQRCMEAGFNDYLSKPVDLKAMLLKIRAHMNNRDLNG
jgi:PAS domain S-box-containing protein